MIGPNCVLATANYPILPELREKAYQYNLPIRIGRNCWLGTGVIVVPSVTIGDNTVIGSFMCQGKMPMSVRQRYENMKKAASSAQSGRNDREFRQGSFSPGCR